MSDIVVFLGPTLEVDVARSIVDADFRPPAQLGDVYRAARERPAVLAIVDGYYERVPAVWHREILWALAHGIVVYGAASMGALRAAELAPFGMRGVGVVYEGFASGALTDDDEVAIVHAPARSRFEALSVAQVNVRATLLAATTAGVLTTDDAARLVEVAKSAFYPDRTWELVVDRATEVGVEQDARDRFARWLPDNAVDQKQLDALELLHELAAWRATPTRPSAPTFEFEETAAWRLLLDTEAEPPTAA